MRWKPGRGYKQIEDRRGAGRGGAALPIGVGGGGIGLVVLVAYLLISVLGGGGGGGLPVDPNLPAFPSAPAAEGTELKPREGDEAAQFVAFIVDDVQDAWARLFAEANRQYEPTKLVLFSQGTQSGCGPASSATGPFYCPRDRKIYLDMGFFDELSRRFGAPGDFAQAYVIAHEFGHHVQTLLGIESDVRSAQQSNPDDANELSVRMELQADCFAGVWGHSAFEEDLLTSGDLQEGLAAAAAIGDDRIQESTQGRVDPESFTHGTSEQRAKWFRRGFDAGDPNACETFDGDI
jgi:predicted metalloprotease